MPPSVTYWTGVWDPSREAISKEIVALRVGARSLAPVVAFAPRQRNRWQRSERVLTLSGWNWPVLRAVSAFVEPEGDITHVFGGQSSWHLMRALGRRPVLLTAVTAAEFHGIRLPMDGLRHVVVESPASIEEWTQHGIGRDQIAIIRPGVAVDYFEPMPRGTSGPFRLLFASTPADPREIAPRGIPLLVELARARPDIEVVMPWRAWGRTDRALRALARLRPPANVKVTVGDVADMRRVYAEVDATVVCFAAGVGKNSPNFAIEGLASGRPCICTPWNGIAGDVREAGAGVVVDRSVEALSRAIDVVKASWAGYSANARRLAEASFRSTDFLGQYEALYAQIAACAHPRARSHPADYSESMPRE
jgi:glycosyltransferase involved in cell wall biosynthesis